jgi:hypothetical protein
MSIIHVAIKSLLCYSTLTNVIFSSLASASKPHYLFPNTRFRLPVFFRQSSIAFGAFSSIRDFFVADMLFSLRICSILAPRTRRFLPRTTAVLLHFISYTHCKMLQAYEKMSSSGKEDKGCPKMVKKHKLFWFHRKFITAMFFYKVNK